MSMIHLENVLSKIHLRMYFLRYSYLQYMNKYPAVFVILFQGSYIYIYVYIYVYIYNDSHWFPIEMGGGLTEGYDVWGVKRTTSWVNTLMQGETMLLRANNILNAFSTQNDFYSTTPKRVLKGCSKVTIHRLFSTSHDLNQWYPSSLMHIFIARP